VGETFSKVATGLMKKTIKNRGVETIDELRELCVEADVISLARQMSVDVFGLDHCDFIADVTGFAAATSFLPVARKADVCLFM
jgi:peroxiredoxin family protein